MAARFVPLLDAWRRNSSAQVKRSNNLKLGPQQLALLKDPSVVASLAEQNAKIAGLLIPTDGTNVFRRFTPESLAAIEQRMESKRGKELSADGGTKKDGENLPRPSSDLEAGKVVPFIYGDVPPELLNTPLEELDPFYKAQKTFVVINKENTIYRFNPEPALFCLSPFNFIRQAAIKVLVHSLFRMFIMIAILTNCVLLTMSNLSTFGGTVELVCIAVYTIEATVKVLSSGFCIGQFTFLRNPWNWLDVVIILFGYITLFIDLGSLTVLAVLKIIPLLPGQKVIVGMVTHSLRRLRDAVIITLFCLVIFAAVALNLFMGVLRRKCILRHPGYNSTLDYSTLDYSTQDYSTIEPTSVYDFDEHINDQGHHYYVDGNLDAVVCGNSTDAGVCPVGYTCMKGGSNPNYGYTNYDTFGGAFLSVIRLITRDFSENLIQLTFRAAGKHNIVFMIFVLFGCFYLINLILAVVAMAYAELNNVAISEAKEKEEEYALILEQMKTKKEQTEIPGAQQREASAVSVSDDQDMSDVNVFTEADITMEEVEKPSGPCTSLWCKFADTFLKWNCCPPWVSLKKWLYAVMMDPFMDLFIVICVIFNIVILAMEHYPMTPLMEETLTIGNLVFISVFTAEMVFKIIAMDPYHYFRAGWNILDSVVVALGLLELALADVEGLSLLRIFRLLRVFKLGKFWPTFNKLLRMMNPAHVLSSRVTLLLGVMVFFFTVVGMQLFGHSYQLNVCKISQDCQLPRWHMHEFFPTLLLIFRNLCGEWIETMWDCMEVGNAGLCVTFFMSMMLIGKLLILHLFLALLLSSFSGDHLASLDKDGEKNIQIAIGRITRGIGRATQHVRKLLGLKPKKGDGKDVNLGMGESELKAVDSGQEAWRETSENGPSKNGPPLTAPLAPGEEHFEAHDVEDDDKKNKKENDVEASSECSMDKASLMEEDIAMPPECCTDNCIHRCPCLALDVTQGKGKVWWSFRRACHAIVEHRYFGLFMSLIILCSSVALVFEDKYLEHRPVMKMVVEYADHVFTFIFLVEMLLKWVAYGFKVYFSNVWCWLDFLILNVSIFSLVANRLGYSRRSSLSFRAVIPLRALSRSKRMKVVVNVIKGAIPSIFNVLLACLLFWLIFSIMGVNLFAGKFYRCLNTTSGEQFHMEEVNNKTECLILIYNNATEVQWMNIKINFDHVMNGYLALFSVATLASGKDVFYAAVDSRMVEDQPGYEENVYISLYFVIFIIFGVFFTSVFFIGAIIENFSQQKAKCGDKNIFITEGQRVKACFRAVKNKVGAQKPIPRAESRLCGCIYDLVTRPCFDIFMMVVVLLSTVVGMMEIDDMSDEMYEGIHYTHLALIFVFLIEFCLKIIGLGKYYFTIGMNILDFVVLILQILCLFMEHYFIYYILPPTLLFFLRLGRIGRVLCLIPGTKGIQTLLFALKMSRHALFNIGQLYFLTVFVFSIFAMSEFAYVKHESGIDDMYNFETFYNSFICLFLATIPGAWEAFLWPILNRGPPDCDPDLENPGFDVKGNCGSPLVGSIFFCSYVVMTSLLVIYMFIAIILENFDFAKGRSTDALSVDENDDEMSMVAE